MFYITTATKKIAKLNKKVRVIQGGTSASKTISIILLLIDAAQRDKKKTLTSIVSESLPHLKRGAIRDFKNIMQAHNYWNEDNWNETDKIYTFETGSQVEFFSADTPDKLRGGRRDRCFINEANNVSLDVFDQLEVRTKEYIFIDYNPITEFWYHTDILNKRDDVDFIILTYKDNEGLSKEIVDSIERRKNRANWWRVYGEGQIGIAEGRIYTDWQTIDDIPHEARLERYGLDFGYSNDPTAIVAIYKWNSSFILDEITYQKGRSNRQIADLFENLEKVLIVADSAEPKSIDELREYGLEVTPSKKGQGSINQGIQVVQDQRIFVTKRSLNLLKEYRNYMWMTEKDGTIINTPEEGFNHCMDAIRYAMQTLISVDRPPSDIDIYFAQLDRNKRGLNIYK